MWEAVSDFPVEQISIVVLLSLFLSYFTWCVVRFVLYELRRTTLWRDVSLRVMTAHGQSDSYYYEPKDDDKLFSWHHHEDCDDEFIHSAVELGKHAEEDLTPEERQLILLYAKNNNTADVPCLPDFDCGISRCLDTIEEESLDDLHSLSDGGSLEWGSWESQSTGSGDDCVTVVEVPLAGRRKQEISTSSVLETESVTVLEPEFEVNDTRRSGENFEHSIGIHDLGELMINDAASSQVNVSDYEEKLSIVGNECVTHNLSRNEVENANTCGDREVCEGDLDKLQDATRFKKQEASIESSKKVLQSATQTLDASQTDQLLNGGDKDRDWFALEAEKTTDCYPDGIDTSKQPDVFSLSNSYSRCKEESLNNWQSQTTCGWGLEHYSIAGEERTDFNNLSTLPNPSTIRHKNTCLPCMSKNQTTLCQNNVISLQLTETSSELSQNNQTQSARSSPASSNLNVFNEKYEGNVCTRNDEFTPYRDSVDSARRLDEKSDYEKNSNNVIRSTQFKTNLCLKDFDENVLVQNYSPILPRTNGELCSVIETCPKSEKSTHSEDGHTEVAATWEDNRVKTPNNGFSSRHDKHYSYKGSTLHDQNISKEYSARLAALTNNDLRVGTLAQLMCGKQHTSDMDPASNPSDQVSKQNDFILDTDRNKNHERNTTNQETQYLSDLVNAQSFASTLKSTKEIGTKHVPLKHDHKDFPPGRKTGDTDGFQTEDVGWKKNRKYAILSAGEKTDNCNTHDSSESSCISKNHQKVHKNEHYLATEVKQKQNFKKYEPNTFWPQKIVNSDELISINCCKNSKGTLSSVQKELRGEIHQKSSCHDDKSNNTNCVLLTDTEEHALRTVYVCNKTSTTGQEGNVEQDASSPITELHPNNVDLSEQVHSLTCLTLETINGTEIMQQKPDHLNLVPEVSVLKDTLSVTKCEENKKNITEDENKSTYLKENERCILTENVHLVSSDQAVVDLIVTERYPELRCKDKDSSSENNEKPDSSSGITNTQNAFQEEGLESSNMNLTLKNDFKHSDLSLNSEFNVNWDQDLITKTDRITGFKTPNVGNRKKRIQNLIERDSERKARMCQLSSQETTAKQLSFPAYNCQTKTDFDESSSNRKESILNNMNIIGTSESFLFLPTDKISEIIETKPKFGDVLVAPSTDNFQNNIFPQEEKQECTSTTMLGERQSPEGSASVPEQEEPVRLVRQNLRENIVPVSFLDIVYNSAAILNDKKNKDKQLSEHSILSSKTDNPTENKYHYTNKQLEKKDEKLNCQTYQYMSDQKDIRETAVTSVDDICYYNSFPKYTNQCNSVYNGTQRCDLKKSETGGVRNMTGKYFNLISEAKQPLNSTYQLEKENYKLNSSFDNNIITSINDKGFQGLMENRIHSKKYSLVTSNALTGTTTKISEKKQNVLSTRGNTKGNVANSCLTYDYATYYTATAKPEANISKTEVGGSTPNISTVVLPVTTVPAREFDNYRSETSSLRRELAVDKDILVRRRWTRSSPDLRQIGNATQCFGSAPISALLSRPVSERIQGYLEQQTKSKGFVVSPGEKLSRLRRQCNSNESVKEKAARFEAKKVLPGECQVSCALKPSRREVETNGLVNKAKIQKSTVLHRPGTKMLTQHKYRIFSALDRKESQTSSSEEISMNETEVSQIPAGAESDSLAIFTCRDYSLSRLIDEPAYTNSDDIQNVGCSAPGVTSEHDVNNMELLDNKNNRKEKYTYTASNANCNELNNQRADVSGDNEHVSVTHLTNINKAKTRETNLTVSEVEEVKNTKEISELSGFNTLSPTKAYQSSKLSLSVINSVTSSEIREDTLKRDLDYTKASVKQTENNKNLTCTQERSFASTQLHRGVKSRILNARKQFFNEVKNSDTNNFDKGKVGALEKLESFRRRIHAERTKLLVSTPDLAVSVEAAVKRCRRNENGLRTSGEQENEEYGRMSSQVKPYPSCNEDIVWPSCVKTADREISVRERSKSLGYLETNVDTLESREVLETDIDNINKLPQQDSLLSRTRSMAILRENSLARQPSTILDTSRARSMDYLLDEENRQAILPPENTLCSSKTKSEHELIIERSLSKLNLPDWCKGTAKEGFILKRGERRRPTWQRLSSRTPSSTSLTSSSMSGRNVVIPKKVTLPNWRYVESLKLSQESLAVTTLGSISPQEHHSLSRWSSSRLSTNSAPPHSTWTGYHSIKKPYLGWRATMMIPTSSGSVSPMLESHPDSPGRSSVDTAFASASHSDCDLAVKHDRGLLNNGRESSVESSSSSHLYSSDMQRRWNSACPSVLQSDVQENLTVHRPRKNVSPQNYRTFESYSDNEADTESIISHIDKPHSTFQSTSNTALNSSKKSTHSQYPRDSNEKHSVSRSFNRDTPDCVRAGKHDRSSGVAEDLSKKSFLGIDGYEDVIYKNDVSKGRCSHLQSVYSSVPKNSENQLTTDINNKITTSKLTPRDKEPRMSNGQQVIWMESSFVGRRPTTSMVVLPSTNSTNTEDGETSKQQPIVDNSYPNHAPLTETSSLSTQVQTRRVHGVAALYD
ncbi:uncharacterized protein LOC111086770 isoform X2 [Limulus polyphemus]|uniref:Uncharacterized protein LOC111086770 isoform X2 n=1 Tax=Limulus polyphemus TaxID=6850 RepID=A0ABM1SSS2_LIMPO|nr:uncharacterized protein LOC111086770 isoform X2 [Limulus polyphemus]